MIRSMTARAVPPLLLSGALCAGVTGAAAQGAAAGPTVTSSVLVVAPKDFDNDPGFGNGCWVKLYDGAGYIDAQLTLVGPIDRVSTFDNVDSRDRTATLAPGQRNPDLRDKKLGWFDEVHSARVTCTTS